MARAKRRTTVDSCSRCGSTDLVPDATKKSGFSSHCRECRNAPRREIPGHRPDAPGDSAELRDKIRALLAASGKGHKRWGIEQLSDVFNVGVGRVREALEQLHDSRINLRVAEGIGGGLWISPDVPIREPTVIPLKSLKGNKHLFGLTADNHLASKYARMDVLNALFDIWADQGVETVYQCGNMIDGEAPFNKHDLIAHGTDGQLDYFVENWPQRKGITTRLITGDDHEGWAIQREQIDVGQVLEDKARRAGRKDIVYLGHMEHDIILKAPKGQAIMRLIHAGGGSAYATSYSVQKIVESYTGGEKPQVLLVGHFHKAEYGYPREVHVVQAAATQAQTPFMRKKKLQSHLGGWTISFEQSEDGLIHGFTPRYDPFYDREYYHSKQWQYHWKRPKAA